MNNPAERPRRFIWEQLNDIRLSLDVLKRGMDFMTDEIVYKRPEMETLLYQLAALSEGLVEVESRVQRLEKYNSSVYWVFRQLVTVAIVAGISYFVFRFL